MISVVIFINGNPIMARSAVRKEMNREGFAEYFVDDGSIVRHRPDDGAVTLAKLLLNTIKEKERKRQDGKS
jgi:hypothetical protein